MKKKITIFMISLIAICFSATKVFADEVTNQTFGIHIIKYKLESNATLPFEVPLDGTKVESANTENLKTMSGIAYSITRVVPKEGATDLSEATSYENATGSDAFEMTVVTNNEGEAAANGLTTGTYRIDEQANASIKQVMSPVIVQLPLTINGATQDNVYIYPKSSVVNEKEQQKHNTGDQDEVIPQTSGELDSNTQILLMLGFVSIMGIIGITKFKKKKA